MRLPAIPRTVYRLMSMVFAVAVVFGLLQGESAAATHSGGPPGAAPAVATRAMPEPPGKDEAIQELSTLAVEARTSQTPYKRSYFKHWITIDGACDTRKTVLRRDGTDVQVNDSCVPTSGTWFSEYDGVTTNSSSSLDIDHMVPLKDAWESGADSWTPQERQDFANDLTHSQLIAVSASSNRQKGDKTPDRWMPPREGYRCTYARAWVSVKFIYHLTVTPEEKPTLQGELDRCPA